MEDKKPGINEILEKARLENDRKLSETGSLPEAEPKPADETTEKTGVAAPEAAQTETEPAPVSEEDEIIGKYSQRVKFDTDPKTSTDSLRQSLATQMEKDKELLGYYKAGTAHRKNKKFDELYTLINTASLSNVKHRTANFPSAEGHFSDPSEVEKPKVYKQEKIVDGDDTITFTPAQTEGSSSSFDEDYEQLGKKIESGEISFAEDENEDQLTLTEDTAITPADVKGGKPESGSKTSDLLLAMDMMDENSDKKGVDELEEIYGDRTGETREKRKERVRKEKEEKKARKQNIGNFEYTDRSQNGEIEELMRRAVKRSRTKFVLTALLTLVVLYLELAFKDSSLHPEYLRPGRYGTLYILVDMQMMFFIALTMLDEVMKGFTGLFSGKPVPETVLSASLTFSAAYGIVTAFMDANAVSNGMLCLPAAVCALGCAFMKYMQALKDSRCFDTIATSRQKYVAEKLGNTAREGTEFYKYLLDGSELFTAKKTPFVEGFFRRINKRPEGDDLFGFLTAVIFAAGVALFGLQIYRGSDFYQAFAAFSKLEAFSLPVSAFFIISLPALTANLRALRRGSALIGNAVGEEYSDASVISFADTEIYPAALVKIASVKVYGEYRIDRIIYDLAKVFSFVGGPLRTVTRNMISGVSQSYESARLIESAADGICVVIDGQEMFLGKRSYLRRYRFETPYDDGDEKFEETDGSIMYVTLDDKLIAKVYTRYRVSEQFNSLLRDMYKAGLCAGIKTVDPNITASLLEHTVKYKKCPVSILKAGEVSEVEGSSERIDSGIVSNASLHTFLKMFVLCDKVRHITRSNGIINVLSIAFAFLVTFFLAVTGDISSIQSFYPVLYQLLWLLPISVISFII